MPGMFKDLKSVRTFPEGLPLQEFKGFLVFLEILSFEYVTPFR